MCPWLLIFTVMPFWEIFTFPDHSSRPWQWQPDGCWSGWIPVGAREVSRGSLCQSDKTGRIHPAGAQRGGAQVGGGKAHPSHTCLSSVGLILVSLLQPAAGTKPSEAGGQIVLATLIWRATAVPIAGQSTWPFPPFPLLFWGTF